jgi:nucleoside-diphosphate-sugar epimerase
LVDVRAIVLGVNGVTGRAIAGELLAAGWEVTGTGRDAGHTPGDLASSGVTFIRSDRTDPAELAACLSDGADVVVDCVCYTGTQAQQLLEHRAAFGSAVVLSSKAVYVDALGRHSNSDEAPHFPGPVREDQAVLTPDFSGEYDSRQGYGANKVAAEVTLLDSGVPVSVLRPSRIHGPSGSRPREWFVVRRLLDGRRRLPLAHHGRSGNHPSAAANLARLVLTCAEHPGQRVLNAADPGTPTAGEVVRAIASACELPLETVGLPDDAPSSHGWNPWATWPPFFLDTSAAVGLGYRPRGTYAETVRESVHELLSLDPSTRGRLDRDPYFEDLFDYDLDDAALVSAGQATDVTRPAW